MMNEQDNSPNEMPAEAAETTVRIDSKERVALDLFKIVYDEADDMPDSLSRMELLELYNQCYSAVQGYEPEEIIDDGSE
ncbi:MAG: hypothetical protein HUJ29_03530 [Gammaproteobacteria bacterium]|nr:hypothetical protein [Gammaproteobacteria bacterium]